MFYLLYSSVQCYSLGPSGLIKLLLDARAYNEIAGVSGLLMHRDGRFLQMLEGEQNTVHGLFGKIIDDPRHGGISILESGLEDKRLFAHWSMAYDGAPLLESGLPAFRGIVRDAAAIDRLDRCNQRHAAVPRIRSFMERAAPQPTMQHTLIQ